LGREQARFRQRGFGLIGLELRRVAQIDPAAHDLDQRRIIFDALRIDDGLCAGADPVPPQGVEQQRGLMPGILEMIGGGFDAQRASLAVEPCLARQTHRTRQDRVIFVETPLAIDAAADIAAGDAELIGAGVERALLRRRNIDTRPRRDDRGMGVERFAHHRFGQQSRLGGGRRRQGQTGGKEQKAGHAGAPAGWS
jgi:hypothetical protein